MGFSMALNPCLPLGAIAIAAATTADPVNGMQLGLGFGLGAVLIPGLLFGWLLYNFGREIRNALKGKQKTLERSSAAILVMIGIATATGFISPGWPGFLMRCFVYNPNIVK